MGIKRLMLKNMGRDRGAQSANDADFARHVIAGAKARRGIA